MQLPRPRGHKEAQASGPHAPESLLPDDTPLEFRVLLSACRVFLSMEEPAKLEALLQQGPEWERLLTLSNRHGVMPLSCPSATYSKSEGEERSQNRLSEMLSRTLIKLEAIHYYDERHSC